MDLASGLSAASQTITILKQLKELDASIDQALFKAKLLDAQEATHEARSALLDARQALLEKDETILELSTKLKAATSGESCPICSIGSLKTTQIVDNPAMPGIGVKLKRIACDNAQCSYTDERIFDPSNMLKRS